MIKALTKHGNSYALVIEKPILELLRATPDTPFEIMSDGQCLVLTPVRDTKEEKKFQKVPGNGACALWPRDETPGGVSMDTAD